MTGWTARDPLYRGPTTVATAWSLVLVPCLAVLVLISDDPVILTTVVVAGLLAGLPHGALDYIEPWLLRGRAPMRAGPVVALVIAYVGSAIVAWLAWQAAPGVALAGFLLLAAAHFGAGEVEFGRLRDSPPGAAQDTWGGRARVGVMGAVVVFLPITTHPAELRPYLAALVPGWDGALPRSPLVVVAAVIVVAGVGTVVVDLWRRHFLPAVEWSLLITLTLALPPAVSLAVYFGGWHSLRHLSVLVADDPANRQALLRGEGASPLLRLAVLAAVPTTVAFAGLAVLWTYGGGDLPRFVATDIPFLAALTVPHAAIVWWADRTRRRGDRSGFRERRSPLRVR